MVPGSRPLAELEAALLRSTIDAPDSLADQLDGDKADILRAALRVLPDDTAKILIVIDQFEELFTLVDDEETRTRFLEGLTEAVNEPHGRVRILLTLRADFYDRPLHYPTFGARIGDGVVNVVPMAPDELEQAAEGPAARAGVSIAPSLLASLLTDVVGQPGALPLFQYTLTELFDRRAGGKLDLETYEAMGGLRGALTRRADDLFSELIEPERAAARQLFLRLVTIADTDEWSRRRVPASEIVGLDVDVVHLKAVIDAFGGARLLTFDRDQVSGSPTVEVAHEALLTEWERLRVWIEEARDDVRTQARLATAGAEWRSSGENRDYLLSASRLDEFDEWAKLTTMSLTASERAYLDASVAEAEAIAAVEEERAAREMALGRRSKRRLWGLAATIAVLVAAGLFVVIAALLPDGPSVVLFTLADDDSTFDEAMKIGLDRAAAEYSIEARVVEFSVDPVEELRALSEESPDLILMDSFVGAVLDEVAPDFPDVSYMLIDVEGRTLDLAYPNVSMSAIREGGGSYLMGVAAAGKTTTGKVGFVSVQIPGFDDWIAGFVAGVEDTDPSVDVLVKWIGTTETAESGADFSGYAFGRAAPEAKVLANELIGEGADVIFHVAGISGREGVTAGVVEQSSSSDIPLWVIGVDADQFAGASEAERAVLLTSMIKRTDREVFDAIGAFVEGRFTPGVTELDLKTGHVGFSPLGDGIAELVPDLEAARDAIIDGSIVVPDFIQPIPGWPSPDVMIEVVSDGDACGNAGAEPIVTMGDTVTFHIRNDSELALVHFANVDDTGLTAAEITDDFGWLDRVRTQGGRLTFPGGTTQVHARATRSQMILSCFDRASGTVLEPLIIPVAQP
jgi:basic membrane lipoprotein Med (substrate-binding protein (PBP1-ABC) superfamily)